MTLDARAEALARLVALERTPQNLAEVRCSSVALHRAVITFGDDVLGCLRLLPYATPVPSRSPLSTPIPNPLGEGDASGLSVAGCYVP